MGTISKRKRRSFLPASSQLRYAAAYILITAAALFLLNLYASTTIRSVTFHAQADSLESKAQLLSNALLQLDELSAGRAAQAVNSMEELHTTRTVVTDAAGVAVYDSLTTGNAEGKTLLFPELVTALEGSDVFFARLCRRAPWRATPPFRSYAAAKRLGPCISCRTTRIRAS